LLKTSVEVAVQRSEDGHEDRQETEFAHREAAGAAGTLAGGIRLLEGGFRGHGEGGRVEQKIPSQLRD
jgi:hypothetical protein